MNLIFEFILLGLGILLPVLWIGSELSVFLMYTNLKGEPAPTELKNYDLLCTKSGVWILINKEKDSNDFFGKTKGSLLFKYYNSEYGLIWRFSELTKKIDKVVEPAIKRTGKEVYIKNISELGYKQNMEELDND